MNRMPLARAALFVAAALLALSACPPTAPECDPEIDDCFDGGVPDDACNSAAEALANAECVLAANTARSAYIGPPDGGKPDNDWYLLNLPSLTPRSLLHVTGGYAAENTAVNLAVSVFNDTGTMSLQRKVDAHDQGAPRPVDIIFPYSMGNSKLLLLVADSQTSPQPRFDTRSQYQVKWETLENPDGNEPNDTTPTDIALPGSPPTGSKTAALATDNDVDLYQFDSPTVSATNRKIVYVHITAPVDVMKPPPFDVSFTLFDPKGVPVAEGKVANRFKAVDLATAKLATGDPGKYKLEVKGYRVANDPTVIPGDLNLQYTVTVQILDDLDTNEGNDTRAAAESKATGLTPGQSLNLTGRLSYVPDPEWFVFNVSGTVPAVLHVRATVSAAAGRFAPISDRVDRQLRIFKAITTGATASDRVTACKNDNALCPKGYEGSDTSRQLVEALCATDDPAPCLYAERNEFAGFDNLRNFEARVPVTAAGKYYVLFQDDGNNFADDKTWSLEVSLDADPDDATRAGLPFQTQVSSVSSGSFPTPPTSGQVSGVLSFGYGRVLNNQPDHGEGARTPTDYDAVPTDFDRFEFDFPGGTTGDQSWSLGWDVIHDGGSAAGDLTLEVEFCDSTRPAPTDGGQCAIVMRALAYQEGRIAPWYGKGLSDRTVIWDKASATNQTTVTATPAGCFCFEPRFTAAGKYFVRVGAVDRVRQDPIGYRLRQGIASYPQTYAGDGGAQVSCPAVATDGGGGCRFSGG